MTEPSTTQQRNWFDKFVDDWRHSNVPLVMVPLLLLGFQMALLAQLSLMNRETEPDWPLAEIAVTMVAAVVALGWRRRWPIPVLALELALPWALIPFGIQPAYLTFPALDALAIVITRCSVPTQLIATVTTVASSLLADKVSAHQLGGTAAVLPTVVAILVVAGCAWMLRLRQEQLEASDLHSLADRLSQEQAESRRQSRIATELHDGVGHNLTAMIALTEGIEGSTDPEQLNDALEMVNQLARDSLDDTRRTVRLLQPGAEAEPLPQYDAGWGEIDGVLSTVRKAGLVVTLAETGSRPANPAVGVLAHTVIREGLTNVMRHADGATRANIAMHHGSSLTTITITDDGVSEFDEVPVSGTGLQHLKSEIEEAGGDFFAGPTDHGWRVIANIPSDPKELR